MNSNAFFLSISCLNLVTLSPGTGCGSSCIYSLLAAKKNGWSMTALETNKSNLEYAAKNVERNNLCKIITISAQKQNDNIFEELFENAPGISIDGPYNFCLCNPPFYDSQLSTPCNTRNPGKRPPPHNCPTGFKEELSCLGGEVTFVEKIIEESVKYKSKIR